jgi:hypothetical protein
MHECYSLNPSNSPGERRIGRTLSIPLDLNYLAAKEVGLRLSFAHRESARVAMPVVSAYTTRPEAPIPSPEPERLCVAGTEDA